MQVDALPTTTVPVRNRALGPTVFRDAPSDTTIRWEGAGDPSGNDVLWVEIDVYRKPEFQKMVRKGYLIAITEDEAMALATGEATSAPDALANQAAAAFHRPQLNDLVGTPCVGPGARPGSACPNQVSIRQSEMGTRPPLCDAHSFMAPEFVPSETVDPASGRSVRTWARAGLTAPITEAQQAANPPTAYVG